MKNGQLNMLITELGNVGIALSQVEVRGENNLNLLLASIQSVRNVKNALKEVESHDDHDEQGADV